MNEVTEWLEYARSHMRLLADFSHESHTDDFRRASRGVEAIDAWVHIGFQCSAQAHARILWGEGSAYSDLRVCNHMDLVRH